MSEINPDALSLEDPTIDGPPIQQPPHEPDATATADAAEPEGVVEHQGRRMVDVSVLAAERKRVREATSRAKDAELAPLKAKALEADGLRRALAEAGPYIDLVRQHPELLQPPKASTAEEQVSDDEAAAEARDLELYDAITGQPDLTRAKRIIARRRTETATAAHAAAQAAIGPITSSTAHGASRQNFVSMAMQRDAANQPLVDPKVLAELWAQLPSELTAHPEVGEWVLDAAIGKSLRTSESRRVPRAERAPLVSEAPGGRSGPAWQMDTMAKQLAKNAGISAKDFEATGKTYVPGAVNILGD